MPSFERRDLQHVGRSLREAHGLRVQAIYIWLVETIKLAACDEDSVYETRQFQVKDVFASAILVAANEALLEIAESVEAPEAERGEIGAWISRGLDGLERCW